MNSWGKLSTQFLALTVRERMLILIAGAVLIVMGLFVLVVEPTIKHNAQVKQRLANMQIQMQSLETQEQALKIQLSQDPNDALNARIDALGNMMAGANIQLSERLGQLVPARQMPALLQDLLKNNTGVRLLEMRSVQPQAVVAPETDNENATALYRHGVALVLEGGYADVQQYLKELESLPWQFQWQSFDYQVTEHPIAKVTLEVFTVSTSEAFIGV